MKVDPKNPVLSSRDIVVMDLEASALGAGTYPIEVGLAAFTPGVSEVRTWSALIQPTADWAEHGVWSAESAAVHGIPFADLSSVGRPVDEICDLLNHWLPSARLVMTDAPEFDQQWLSTLFDAAGRKQRFGLEDFDMLTAGLEGEGYKRMIESLERSPIPHRAGPDALRLAAALLGAQNGIPPKVTPLSD